MRVAHNKDGNRIYIDEVIGNNEQYYCPACGAELILKRGNIKTHHFAHKSLIDCDTFNHDMSEWHLNWQETFPKENREVVIEMDIHNDYDSKQNYDMYYTIDENINYGEMKRCIWDLLDTLTEREKEVLILRFGLIDNMPKTLEEVGKQFFVQCERVRQIENKALKKLRHPTRYNKLREFLYD